MKRPDIDEYFLMGAAVVAALTPCRRHPVGAGAVAYNHHRAPG